MQNRHTDHTMLIIMWTYAIIIAINFRIHGNRLCSHFCDRFLSKSIWHTLNALSNIRKTTQFWKLVKRREKKNCTSAALRLNEFVAVCFLSLRLLHLFLIVVNWSLQTRKYYTRRSSTDSTCASTKIICMQPQKFNTFTKLCTNAVSLTQVKWAECTTWLSSSVVLLAKLKC